MAFELKKGGAIAALACLLLSLSASGARTPEVTRQSTVEEELASLRLGTTLPKNLRCAAAVPKEFHTTHQFRGAGLGIDGKDAFLVVDTECMKADECASDAERAILAAWVQSSPINEPVCPLPPSVRLVTSRGLRLGDAVAKVGELYGRPHRASPRKGPLRKAEYAGRLQVRGQAGGPGGMDLYVGFTASFKDGRVDGMAIYIDTDPH